MAATLQASTKGLDLVDKARCKKGWAKTSQTWADLIPTSKATLRRFWAGVPIQSETFKGICIAAGIEDWELISNREPVTHSKNDKTVSRKHTKRLVISFDTDIESIDQRELGGIIAAISRLGGNATINLLDVDEGSLKLIFGGSPEDFEKIESLYRLGELTDILDITVQDIHVLSKTELAQTLIKNGGVALDLSYANLSHTELAGANLSHANLSHTELAGANLSHANLSHTELAGADITQAIFSDNLGLSVSDRSALMLRGATFQDSSVVKESKVSQLDLVLRESDEGFSGNESSSSDPFSGNDSWESRREASVVNIAPYKATPIKGSAISGMLPYLSRSDQYQLLNELHDLLDEPLVASFKNSPYQVLRLRQASISFYMAVGFSVISVVLSLSLGFFLITGVISQPLLAVSSMVASGAASLYGYKLYEGANKRLEAYWNIMLRRYKLPDSNPGEVLDDASTSDTPG